MWGQIFITTIVIVRKGCVVRLIGAKWSKSW
jgi:hypothetical protein